MSQSFHLKTSLFAKQAQPSPLSNALVAARPDTPPLAPITVRDPAPDAVPHLDAARFKAFRFNYGETGPQGPLTGTREHVFARHGGKYAPARLAA